MKKRESSEALMGKIEKEGRWERKRQEVGRRKWDLIKYMNMSLSFQVLTV